jgi:hypothetical protein
MHDTLPSFHLCLYGIILWYAGPYLRTGHRGLGPGRQISRGVILKKSRLKYGMRNKRLSTREKFKGDLYWKQCWYRVFSLRRYWR